MLIGVPKEIKRDEYRVAILPVGVEDLIRGGHQVLIEAGAGLGSGIADHEYLRAGVPVLAIGREASNLRALLSESGAGEWFPESMCWACWHTAACWWPTTAG